MTAHAQYRRRRPSRNKIAVIDMGVSSPRELGDKGGGGGEVRALGSPTATAALRGGAVLGPGRAAATRQQHRRDQRAGRRRGTAILTGRQAAGRRGSGSRRRAASPRSTSILGLTGHAPRRRGWRRRARRRPTATGSKRKRKRKRKGRERLSAITETLREPAGGRPVYANGGADQTDLVVPAKPDLCVLDDPPVMFFCCSCWFGGAFRRILRRRSS